MVNWAKTKELTFWVTLVGLSPSSGASYDDFWPCKLGYVEITQLTSASPWIGSTVDLGCKSVLAPRCYLSVIPMCIQHSKPHIHSSHISCQELPFFLICYHPTGFSHILSTSHSSRHKAISLTKMHLFCLIFCMKIIFFLPQLLVASLFYLLHPCLLTFWAVMDHREELKKIKEHPTRKTHAHTYNHVHIYPGRLACSLHSNYHLLLLTLTWRFPLTSLYPSHYHIF